MAFRSFTCALIAISHLTQLCNGQGVITLTRTRNTCSHTYAPFTTTVIASPTTVMVQPTPVPPSSSTAGQSAAPSQLTVASQPAASSPGTSLLWTSSPGTNSPVASLPAASLPASSQSAAGQLAAFKPSTAVSQSPSASAVSQDVRLNSGEPFNVQIMLSPGMKRQASVGYYIMPNGNTTLDRSKAANFTIRYGQLFASGLQYSANVGVSSQPFAASSTVGSITGTFSVQSGGLTWSNPQFANGTAQFVKVPKGVQDNAQILAVFNPPSTPPPEWSSISFYANPGKQAWHVTLT